MQTINWIEIGFEFGSFLAISYLIFYQGFLKSFGRKIVELATVERLTTIQENVKQEFNEKIESYKMDLSAQLAEKIEPLKSELTKNNISYQIEYGHLHQKRGEVILELYQKLQELHGAMAHWTARMHPIIEDAEKEAEERHVRVSRALNDFQYYYIAHKLFFAKSFCKSIDDIFESYWKLAYDFGFKSNALEKRSLTPEFIKEYIEETSKISKEIRDKFPSKIEEIEDEFRKILGVKVEGHSIK